MSKEKIIIESNPLYREKEAQKEPQNYFRWNKFLLFILILLAYAPFMGVRLSRTAGDDKVYVAQAMEMHRAGSWFVQTLADEPDYRKGPFHYIFLRIGFFLFGNSMWATLYMNLICIFLGAFAIARLVGRHLGGDESWALWAGVAFALNMGIFTHAFASQMEVELASIYAVAIYFLDRVSREGNQDWIFWVFVGIAGTIKAPLHSIFLGFTAILFWFCEGSLSIRIKSWKAWLGLLLGVLICGLAYLPALIFDQKNFLATYLGRENLEKSANGTPWHYPVLPVFTYFLFPWVLPAFVAYADGLRRLFFRICDWKQKQKIQVGLESGHERLVVLGWCVLLPSIAFFLYHPYRGQNYHLPVISGLIIFVAAIWFTANHFWKKIYTGALVLTGAFFLLVPITITMFAQHFKPMPNWWWEWTIPALWIGFGLSAKGFIDESITFQLVRPGVLARKSLPFVIALGVLQWNIGEREMIDLQKHYKSVSRQNPYATYFYYNLQKNVWSEWAYLNFWAGVPVYGMHKEEVVEKYIQDGNYFLIPGDDLLEKFQKIVLSKFPNATFEAKPWRRWRTKGKSDSGEPLWKEAWKTKNLSKIEKIYWIVEVKNAKH